MHTFFSKHQLVACIAPLMLVTVALLQLSLAHTYDFSPWKGGGFGMFSTVDSPGARFLRITIQTDAGELQVPPPAALSDQAGQLRTMPSEQALLRYAKAIAAGTWYIQVGREIATDTPAPTSSDDLQQLLSNIDIAMVAPGEPLPTGARAIALRGAHIELLRFRFDTTQARVEAESLHSLTLNVP